jgi:hypothetical protein
MSECKRWGVYIPAQWVEEISSASSKEVAEEVARKVIRGPVTYEVRPYPHAAETCWCGEDHSP